jgi:hypothetical protein
MANTVQKTFQPTSEKDVRYLNRDFSQLKESLINFAKVYFPNSYKDFSDSSPGMMFIEMAAYVGDVLSYYTDYIFKEGLLYNTTERKNIISLAKYLGYKVKPTKAAIGTLDIFQLIPAKQDSVTGEYVPNLDYALIIKENMQVVNNNGQYYITNDPINFSVDTKLSPRETTVYSRDISGSPTFFLLKKNVKISAGKLVSKSFSVSDPTPFLKLTLDEDNVIEIIDIVDEDNNEWYQVDYLAQELVLDAVPNDPSFEGDFSQYRDEIPYILKYIKTSKRFTVNVTADNLTYLEFGAGQEGFSDEIVNLNSQTVGAGLTNISRLNIPYDPSNFLKNQTYGIAPSNTSLTVNYIIGGGVTSNCPSNDIRKIVSIQYDNSPEGMTIDQLSLLNTVKNSLTVNNPDPSTGGKDSETNEEIRQNAISMFSSQNRSVTRDDYLVRVYAMPPKYGSIAKAQIVTNSSLSVNVKKMLSGTVDLNNVATVYDNDPVNSFRRISYDSNNPFAINLYVLGYDQNKNLTKINEALTGNLIKYLKQSRMMTDGINIIDGYIINIGVNFSIMVYKGFNKKEVSGNCIQAVQEFFNIDNWEFSQPINLSQLELEIAKIEGVQSVVVVDVINLTPLTSGTGDYSPIEYDIKSATRNKVIYPSLDPSVFEVKFPSSDIKCTVL